MNDAHGDDKAMPFINLGRCIILRRGIENAHRYAVRPSPRYAGKIKSDPLASESKCRQRLPSIVIIVALVILHCAIKHFTHVRLPMVNRSPRLPLKGALTPSRWYPSFW